jgi:hypothetical protein
VIFSELFRYARLVNQAFIAESSKPTFWERMWEGILFSTMSNLIISTAETIGKFFMKKYHELRNGHDQNLPNLADVHQGCCRPRYIYASLLATHYQLVQLFNQLTPQQP